MQRRGVLALAPAVLAGCVTSARDESGPRNPPTTPRGGEPEAGERKRWLRIVGSDVGEDEAGFLVLSVVVENTADTRRTDTLVGTATVDDTEYEVSQEVSLAGNTETAFELVFEVEYDEWAGNGSLTYGWASEM
jgi:hypothetical protein